MKSLINTRKVHRVIRCNQSTWLKTYIDMKTKLRTEAKNDTAKDFFRLMNNAVFGRTLENVREHRNINLEARNKRKSYLVLEPNYIEQNDSQKVY